MFTNLLIVVAAGLLAPLALGFFPPGPAVGDRARGRARHRDRPLGARLGKAALAVLLGQELDKHDGQADPARHLRAGGGAGGNCDRKCGAIEQPLASAAAPSGHHRADPRACGIPAADRFTALAESVGLETILGAFAAGVLLSLLDRDETTTHPQFRLKLEAVGFGVFIPIFFVTSGLTFDLSALFASSSTIARVPLFLLAILLACGLPALVYVRVLGLSRSLIAGILQATSLPFIVAATQIGLLLGVVSRASAAGLVAAGQLSVVISPALGLVLFRRQRPETGARRALLTPVMPVLMAEDRALARASDAESAA
jgi:hypothetical protein